MYTHRIEKSAKEWYDRRMKEKEFWDYIDYLNTLGSKPGLESICELCHRLDDPQDKLKFIHVAGTNGKGSVCAYLASILTESKIRVGRYQSPAIRTYRERIMVGRQMISKKALFHLMDQIRRVCEEMVRDGYAHPTSFEVETVLGFLYFVEQECDLVILETGMGGTFDATNLIRTTQVAVLTSISMDHMAFLGNTLSEIAQHKAGIIKEHCHVVTCKQPKEVMHVIEAASRKNAAVLHVADGNENEKKEFCVDQIKYGVSKQSFRYGKRLKIEIPLIGRYQIDNAVLALRVVEVLRDIGYRISEQQMLRGFRNTVWDGRFTVLAKKPYFIVDGAHNEDAAKKLADSVQFYFTNKKIIYIMGILKDKEYEKIIQIMAPFADSIITVKTPDNPRAMDAYELAKTAMQYHPKVTCAGSIEEAVEMSYLLSDKDSVILAFGSLSYLGRVMDVMEKRDKQGR